MLEFYIYSTVVSLLVIIIATRAIKARLIREGYEARNKSYSLWERVNAFLPFFVPIINVIIALVCVLNTEKLYEKTKENLKLINSEL